MTFVILRNQRGQEFSVRPLWVIDIEPVVGVEHFDADLEPVPMCIISFVGGTEKIVRGSRDEVAAALSTPEPRRRVMRSVGTQ